MVLYCFLRRFKFVSKMCRVYKRVCLCMCGRLNEFVHIQITSTENNIQIKAKQTETKQKRDVDLFQFYLNLFFKTILVPTNDFNSFRCSHSRLKTFTFFFLPGPSIYLLIILSLEDSYSTDRKGLNVTKQKFHLKTIKHRCEQTSVMKNRYGDKRLMRINHIHILRPEIYDFYLQMEMEMKVKPFFSSVQFNSRHWKCNLLP